MADKLCLVCGQNKGSHAEDTRHEFNSENSELKAKREEVLSKEVRVPSDPILRFILIEKGIITPEDLTNAEKKLRALGSLVTSTPIV